MPVWLWFLLLSGMAFFDILVKFCRHSWLLNTADCSYCTSLLTIFITDELNFLEMPTQFNIQWQQHFLCSYCRPYCCWLFSSMPVFVSVFVAHIAWHCSSYCHWLLSSMSSYVHCHLATLQLKCHLALCNLHECWQQSSSFICC